MTKIRKALVTAALFVGAVLGAQLGFSGGMPPIPSNPTFSEPSQIISTLNSFINQLNGNPLGSGGYAAQPGGIASVGLYCMNAAAGGTPQTCNGAHGAVSYTGLTSSATGVVQTVVVADSFVTTASICNAFWITAGTAGSARTIATVVPTAGTLTVISVNAGTTTDAVTTGTLGFNCVN
jgi:hypothetical protein